jgi:hypothetical protein
MWRVILVVSMLYGCTSATLLDPQISTGALAKQRLPISMKTMESLVAFAAKDRVCRAILAKSLSEQEPRGEPGSIVPRVHSYDPLPGTIDFAACIYTTTKGITECDATAEDLSSFRTLLDSDQKLKLAATFDEVTGSIRKKCGVAMKVGTKDRVVSWPNYKLRRCSMEGMQPVLIAEAISISLYKKILIESNQDLMSETLVCQGTVGEVFLRSTHCPSIGFRNRHLASNRVRSETASLPTVVDLGLEEYFCPAESAQTSK